MIKYISEDSQFNKNFDEQNPNIGYYQLSSYDLTQGWKHFSPTNMNSNVTSDGSFKVFFQDESETLEVYRAFNHQTRIDLGRFSYQIREKNIYFHFSEEKCIHAMKFNLHNSSYPFYLSLWASKNNNTWTVINKLKIGSYTSMDDMEGSFIYVSDKSGGGNLKGNPTVVCKFNNYKKYKYYRLIFSTTNQYSFGIEISKMFLYDNDNVFSHLLYFPLQDDMKDENGQIYYDYNNVDFQGDCCHLENNSYIMYSPTFPKDIGNCSICFKANLFKESVSGTLISKGYEDGYLDGQWKKRFLFNLKCSTINFIKDDSIKNIPLTFIALQDGTIQYYFIHSGQQQDVYYSKNHGKTWNKYKVVYAEDGEYIINVLKGQEIMFLNLSSTIYAESRFSLTGKFNLAGDLSSLTRFNRAARSNQLFRRLFAYNDSIIDSSKLVLSYTHSSYNGYSYMFENCVNLISSPRICNIQNWDDSNMFSYMFYGCSSLKQIHIQLTPSRYNYVGNHWVNGVAEQGIFIKHKSWSDSVNVNWQGKPHYNNVPNENWQIIDVDDYDYQEFTSDISNTVVFQIETKFYNEKVFVDLQQVRNKFCLYSFVFGSKFDKFLINGSCKFKYQYESENDYNRVFESGAQACLVLGSELKSNNYSFSNFINGMKLKQLSFYNYDLSEAQIRNIMNKE